VPDYQRIYLDADVYLALIKGEVARVDIARSLLRDGQEKRFAIVASTLVYAEVCGHGDVRSANDAALVDAKVSAFFEHGFIQWVEVDLVVAREARRLSREHRLRGADAIHLALGRPCLLSATDDLEQERLSDWADGRRGRGAGTVPLRAAPVG
jgi:predicted nucleic acid-binding protein